MYSYNEDLIKKDSEFKYYFLGLIASDGWVSDKSNRIELCLNKRDKHILIQIRDLLCPGKKIVDKQKQNAFRLTLENKTIWREVTKYLDPGNKTFSLIFPYGIPGQYIKDFIRGYIDGDGNISVKRGQRKLSDGSIKYYYGLRLRVLGTRALLQGLHMNLKLYCNNKFNVKPHKKDGVYYIEYGFSAAENVLNFIYRDATYYLLRKRQVFEHISTLDNETLAANYGTANGRYNMQRPTVNL